MSLFGIFRPEKNKRKVEELKQALQFNPEYFKELERIRLIRDSRPYM